MSRLSITPPRVKFELHAYGEVYDFSNCLDNWKMLEFTLTRDDTSGIFHQISFPFEFVLDAYDVVKDIYDKYKYRAKADMYIYQLKDTWPYEKEDQYFEPEIFNLDFTQYNKSDTKIEIDSKRSDLYNYIKAKNKIVYDIPVSEIKEDKQWNFERIQLENSITCLTNNAQLLRVRGTQTFDSMVGISHMASDVVVKDRVYVNTVGDWVDYNPSNHFLEINRHTMPIGDKAIFKMNIKAAVNPNGTEPGEAIATMILTKNYDPSNPTNNAIAARRYVKGGTATIRLEWVEDIEVDIKNGDKFYLVIHATCREGGGLLGNQFRVSTSGDVKMIYQARSEATQIDLIDPKVLLQSIVDKMTGSKGLYYSDIEDFNINRDNLIMLSAAESIRGIQKTELSEPQVHTSYVKYVEWMNTYGYEQHVEGSKLTFRKRHKGFRPDLTAIELQEHECADLREYVNEEYLYSGIKIGYNRKDIENTNVRFEFNGVHDYSTDLNMGEHMLVLISPYRADCYGIEFLAQERGKDSADDKSDKDLFLINVGEDSESYTTIYNRYSGNYPNDTLFNGNLNPYNLMKLNENLIGVSVEQLTFAASDSNSQIVIDEQRIDVDYEIPKGAGLFGAEMIDIASKNIQNLPSGENVNGVVRIHYRGEIHEGYIEQVSKNPAWETETIWVLYKKKG